MHCFGIEQSQQHTLKDRRDLCCACIHYYAWNHFDCIFINVIIISIYTSAYKRVRSHEVIIYACDIRTQNVLLPMQPGPARLPAKNERFIGLAQAARRSSWPPNLRPARFVSRVYLEICAPHNQRAVVLPPANMKHL